MGRKQKASVIIQVTFPGAWEAYVLCILREDDKKKSVRKSSGFVF